MDKALTILIIAIVSYGLFKVLTSALDMVFKVVIAILVLSVLGFTVVDLTGYIDLPGSDSEQMPEANITHEIAAINDSEYDVNYTGIYPTEDNLTYTNNTS